MIAAILKLLNFEHDRLFCLANLFFGYAVDFVAGLLVFDDFIFEGAGYIRIVTKPVINCCLNFLNDWSTDFYVTKLILCLAGKHRIIETDFEGTD